MEAFAFEREGVALHNVDLAESVERLRTLVQHRAVAMHHHAGMAQHDVSAKALRAVHLGFVETQVISVFQHNALVGRLLPLLLLRNDAGCGANHAGRHGEEQSVYKESFVHEEVSFRPAQDGAQGMR